MKKINAAQLDLIDAIVAEFDIGGLNASILEKDIHVTDALSALMNINDQKIKLIFCGGTSLSKAFNAIERMSEDVDIKIDISQLSELSTSARKKYLSAYKDKIKSALVNAGFAEDEVMADAKNANCYFATEWFYHSEYENAASLRPRLKIEVKTCQIICPTETKVVGYLTEKFTDTINLQIKVQCQAIEETLAEKVISFLRRYDRAIANDQTEPWDGTLVRHIYDVYCITFDNSEIIKESKICFPKLLQIDAIEFGNQHPAFKLNPVNTLLKSLEKSKLDPSIANDYKQKLIPLIFGKIKPNYKDAFNQFYIVARTLLESIEITQFQAELLKQHEN